MEIILTQLHLSAGVQHDRAVRAVIDMGSPVAEVSLVYQSVEDETEYGLVQYLPAGISRGHVLPPLSPDSSSIARYWSRELTDTGPVQEIAPILMVVAFNIPTASLPDVEAWYSEEHIPMLSAANGWLRARRYEAIEQQGGPVYNSLALHELRDESVLDSPERKAARSIPWRAKFSSEPWFQQAGRWVYRRIGSEGPYIG